MSIERFGWFNEDVITRICEAERQKLIGEIACLTASDAATEQRRVHEVIRFNDVGLVVDISRDSSRLSQEIDSQGQEEITILTWLENRDLPRLKAVCGSGIPSQVSFGTEGSTTDYKDEDTATILADAAGKFAHALISHRDDLEKVDVRLQTAYTDIVYILSLGPNHYAWRVMADHPFSTEHLNAMAENVRDLPSVVETASQKTKLGTHKNTKSLVIEKGSQSVEFSNFVRLDYDIEGNADVTRNKSIKVSDYYRAYRESGLKILKESVNLSIYQDGHAMIKQASQDVAETDYGLKAEVTDLPERTYPRGDQFHRIKPERIATTDDLFWFQDKIVAARKYLRG